MRIAGHGAARRSGGELRLLGRDPARPRAARRDPPPARLPAAGARASTAHFTAFEFVDYVAILKEWTDRGERHDEVRRVLAAVGLDDVAPQAHPRRCRAACGGGSRSRRRCSATPSCSCSTSRPPASIPSSGCASASSSRAGATTARCCSPRTRPRTSPRCASASSCCATAAVAFDGTPRELAELAARPGVDRPTGATPARRLAWRTGDGAHRHVGEPPAGRASSSSRRSRTATCCCSARPALTGVAA